MKHLSVLSAGALLTVVFAAPAFSGTSYNTRPATNITQTSAQLNGHALSTIGLSGELFEYGTTTDYGLGVAANPQGVQGPVSGQISNLSCGTLYHFRFFGDPKPPRTTSQGPDLTFTTEACTFPSIPNVSFETGNRFFFSAEGGGTVNADQFIPQSAELFSIIDLNGGELVDGDSIQIKTSDDYYFSAELGGGAGLDANQTAASTSETFTIILPNSPGELVNTGDAIALKTSTGHFVQADGNGGLGVNAQATDVGCNENYLCSWEMFRISLVAPTVEVNWLPIISGGGNCLDVPTSDLLTDGGKVQTWACDGEVNQRWLLTEENTIVNQAGKCLDLHGPDYNSQTNGGLVQIWECHGGDNQKWHFTNGNIISENGMCLDVDFWDLFYNGAKVQVWQCNGYLEQYWDIPPVW